LPFLFLHDTSGPTVAFIDGLAFCNALRYNGKKAVPLACFAGRTSPRRRGESD
jgi:hypothetical protein